MRTAPSDSAARYARRVEPAREDPGGEQLPLKGVLSRRRIAAAQPQDPAWVHRPFGDRGGAEPAILGYGVGTPRSRGPAPPHRIPLPYSAIPPVPFVFPFSSPCRSPCLRASVSPRPMSLTPHAYRPRASHRAGVDIAGAGAATQRGYVGARWRVRERGLSGGDGLRGRCGDVDGQRRAFTDQFHNKHSVHALHTNCLAP